MSGAAHDPRYQALLEEAHVALIHELASNGLEKVGHHGAVAAMGVPRQQLPTWDDLQFLTAQLATLPYLLVGPKLGFLPSHPVSASLGNYRLVCKSLLPLPALRSRVPWRSLAQAPRPAPQAASVDR